MSQFVQQTVADQYPRVLNNLKNILQKACDFANERGFDENQFLSLKAAPDMFPLVRQVQIVTDVAKISAARLAGKTAPSFEDKESTMAELFERIDKTLNFLKEMQDADYSNYESVKYTSPHRPGLYLMGKHYFSNHSLPNIYFHLSTTYFLLRSHGVQLGKGDFLGDVPWQKEN